ncbi:YdcF family protein, partial [Salmonella enterica subsp. enterica serovar Kottbus]|nr:YdcF family protein [Salmonella enterica subsp. enterica serovar Kottbus]
NSAGDRIVETAILARRYPDSRIVVTGGGGTMINEGEADGATAPRLLEALGVERARMVLEDQSRDTYENAVFTHKLVEPKPGETWLLVTSAFHMPRSVLLFRKAGFEVVPWPADYRSTGEDGPGLTGHNIIHTMQTTGVALKEWIGLVAYRLTGRTDSVLP